MLRQEPAGVGYNKSPQLFHLMCKPIQILVFTILFTSQAQAFDDPISTPAIQVAQASRSLLLDVAIAGNRLVAVGERGHIVYSNNGGKTWQQAKVPVQVMLTAVTFPGNGLTGWAVGHQGIILVSHDGGLSWSKQLDGYQSNQLMLEALSDALERKGVMLQTAAEEDQELILTELETLEILLDDARAFVEEGPTRPFVDVWFRNTSEGYAVGAFGLIVRTENGGKTWFSPAASMHNDEARHYNAIDAHGDTLFIVGESGHIQRSLDGGRSWTLLESPYIGSYFNVVVEQDRVLLLGLRGNAFVSFDQGANWSEVDSGTTANLSEGVALSDGRVLVSQYGSQLLISNESVTSFTPLPETTGSAVSSFVLRDDGSVVTVGTGGARVHADLDFSIVSNAK